MRIAMIVIAIAALVGWGAWHQMHAGPSTLQSLMAQSAKPTPGGIIDVTGQVDDVGPVTGCTTIFAFYDPHNRAHRKLTWDLQDLIQMRPDVLVQQYNLDSAMADHEHWADKYKVTAMPCVFIFDSSGKLLARDEDDDRDGVDLLTNWMAAERTQAGKAGR